MPYFLAWCIAKPAKLTLQNILMVMWRCGKYSKKRLANSESCFPGGDTALVAKKSGMQNPVCIPLFHI